ncbi:hypothetical protein RQCS_59270 (plasmid) [Rhodococcus qingshengii]|nr:hypothetical protein RQCS_59270 [Rhodococcus qingshengii]
MQTIPHHNILLLDEEGVGGDCVDCSVYVDLVGTSPIPQARQLSSPSAPVKVASRALDRDPFRDAPSQVMDGGIDHRLRERVT